MEREVYLIKKRNAPTYNEDDEWWIAVLNKIQDYDIQRPDLFYFQITGNKLSDTELEELKALPGVESIWRKM